MIINITDPSVKIFLDNSPLYNGEYLLFSFEAKELRESIIHKNFNTYIDGVLQ